MFRGLFLQNFQQILDIQFGVHVGGNTPKLVEWVNFRNFGYKVNLVTKTLSECTNALPDNVNGGEFVKGCST